MRCPTAPSSRSDGEAFAVRGDRILRWTPQGYDAEKPRPRGATVDVLTPPAILAVLSAGYGRTGIRARQRSGAVTRYGASGVGLSAGGSMPNVFAVMHVIEKLPVVATAATKLSMPKSFSAAA